MASSSDSESLQSFYCSTSDNSLIASEHTSERKTNPIQKVLLNPIRPYLILGFGRNISTRSSPDRPRDCDYHPDIDFGVSTEVIGGRVPWSNESIQGCYRGSVVEVQVPPCTDVVGAASGAACFPNDSIQVIEFDSDTDVLLPNKQYVGSKGIIYPISYPRTGRVVCRGIRSRKSWHPKNHHISTGILY